MSRVKHKYLVIRRVLTEKVPFYVIVYVLDKGFEQFEEKYLVENYSETHYRVLKGFLKGAFLNKNEYTKVNIK